MSSKPEAADAAPTLPGRDGQAVNAGQAAPVVNAHDLIEGFRLELPRGGWVQFGSVLDVSGGVRERIVADVRQLTLRIQSRKATNEEFAAVNDDVTTRILRAVVQAWSYDIPLPVPKDALDRLPAVVVDEVSAVASEYMKRLVLQARRSPGLGDGPPRSRLLSLSHLARRTAVRNVVFAAVGASFAWLLFTALRVLG